MDVSELELDETYTYAVVGPIEGRLRKVRVHRSTGQVQVEAHDRRHGLFWRRMRSETAEQIRLRIADVKRAERRRAAFDQEKDT